MSVLRALLMLCSLCVACQRETPYAWQLPDGYPAPNVPADNPLTLEKVELGRHLFYDKRLSGNGTQACAGCHQQALAFTDGRVTALGSTGEAHFRNTQPLANVAYAASLTWASPNLVRLETQALNPMFGERPVEMGLTGHERELFARLRKDPRYQQLFARAFPTETERVSLRTITQALASFVRTIVSYRSPYDRYVYGHERNALSVSAVRGMELFFSERLECFHCHNGFNFSDATVHANSKAEATGFHNTGLYDVDGTGAYPVVDQGLYELTHLPSDRGRFRAPSLRNVELTGPYMHDGSIATLEQVLDHYARGGKPSPLKADFVRGFILNDRERHDVIAFLESLTDRELLKDPAFRDPWH